MSPVGVSVSPPSGVVLTKLASVDFFQVVVAPRVLAGESMSVAVSVTVAIGSLY